MRMVGIAPAVMQGMRQDLCRGVTPRDKFAVVPDETVAICHRHGVPLSSGAYCIKQQRYNAAFQCQACCCLQLGVAPHRLACVSLSLMSSMPFSSIRQGARSAC